MVFSTSAVIILLASDCFYVLIVMKIRFLYTLSGVSGRSPGLGNSIYLDFLQLFKVGIKKVIRSWNYVQNLGIGKMERNNFR